MKHIVIITGGYLDIEWSREYIKTLSYDKVFAVDKGLEYAECLGICPDYIVGDFDSVERGLLAKYEQRIAEGNKTIELERHPAKKDATDTELALIRAIKEGAGKVTLLAAAGSRTDHTLANIGLLKQAAVEGLDACMVDRTNRIRLLSSENNSSCRILKKEQYGTYLSLLPLSEQAEGVSAKGVLYPVENTTVFQGSSLTVSNEITGEQAYISVKKGNLLVIESRDL